MEGLGGVVLEYRWYAGLVRGLGMGSMGWGVGFRVEWWWRGLGEGRWSEITGFQLVYIKFKCRSMFEVATLCSRASLAVKAEDKLKSEMLTIRPRKQYILHRSRQLLEYMRHKSVMDQFDPHNLL